MAIPTPVVWKTYQNGFVYPEKADGTALRAYGFTCPFPEVAEAAAFGLNQRGPVYVEALEELRKRKWATARLDSETAGQS